MKIKHIKITPALAEKWLLTVPAFQRKIDQKQVVKLTTAIERGEWRENGATIVFNANGELIDGQHRLQAIVACRMPVYSLVVTNVSSGEETFNTIGDSKAKSLNDFIKVPNASIVSGVLRIYWGYKNGQWPYRHSVVPPISDILKLGKEHIEYISTLVPPINNGGRLIKEMSFCTFLAFYFTKVEPQTDVKQEKLVNFFARLSDGLNLEITDPVYLLRRKFISLRETEDIPRHVRQGLILKSLITYVNDLPITMLVYNPNKEGFPDLTLELSSKKASWKKGKRQSKRNNDWAGPIDQHVN